MSRKTPTTIREAIARPSFSALARLRSGGHDQYSRMSLAQLQAQPEPIIDTSNLADRDKAAAYRWVRRGLPAAIAIKKIRVDQEIAANAGGGGWHDDDEWQDHDEDLHAAKEEWANRAAEEDSAAEAKRETPKPQYHPDGRVETYLAGNKHHHPAHTGRVDLIPEPSNPHDPNAIAVWQDGCQIGYVPAVVAKDIDLFATEGVLEQAEYPSRLLLSANKLLSVDESLEILTNGKGKR